jgi:CRISPR/Cas system-associated protein Cas10 (large subunit of type III CRISPR-Cas system)
MWYYLEHPDILFNDWLTIAKTILRAFYEYAGIPEEAIPQWLLDEVVESATSQTGLAEARASNIAAALHDIIQNQGWVKNKREAAIWIAQNLRNKLLAEEFDYETPAARKTIDEVMANATLEEKLRALIALDTLPHFKWHHDIEVCIMSSIVEELRRRGISRVSHKQIASYCNGFTYEKIWLGSKQCRVVHSKLKDFVVFTNPGQHHHHLPIQAAM